MKRALVTGATGMLGSYVVERFVAQGWAVRALVRDTAAARWLEPLGATLARGDIADAASLRDAAAGCDAIVHTAAAIGPGSDWQAFHALNVAATEHVIQAAALAGARLVHVSTTAVYDTETRFRFAPTHEEVPISTLRESDAYGRTKQEGERAVLRANDAGEIWASVVRPPVMYGVRDRQFIPRVAPLLQRGVFPVVDGGRTRLIIVHAGAVADGAVRAATTDAARGRVYHLANDFDLTVVEFARLAGEGLGRRICTPSVPLAVARAGFWALRAALVLAGRGDLAAQAPGTLAMLTRDNPFSSERARRELGWAPSVPPSVALPEAFRWWAERYGKAKATR